ncbi:spermidine synthase [Actinokineospora inagensis]|uniref:spermidine synthase n=1 Tax=Actinokineospora inagensis TaxID=103730 RepID=UPI000411A076|nr:fused MFS/spermidine synthase [Actinokineospora inagensis]
MRFGTAEIVRDLDRANGWLLSVDGVAQSYVDLDDPRHLEFDYVCRIADVLDSWGDSSAPVDALHVGGGACTLPRYLAAARPGSQQVVVDADPALVALVRDQFAVDTIPDLDIVVGDGRTVVSGVADLAVDLVLVDAFERGQVSAGMYSVEATRDLSRVLRATGVYLANLSDGPGLPFAGRVVATLSAVFGNVLLLAEPGVLRGRRYGNIVLAASAGDLPTEEIAARAAAAAFPARCVWGAELRALVGPARLLTDAEPVTPPTLPTDPFVQSTED